MCVHHSENAVTRRMFYVQLFFNECQCNRFKSPPAVCSFTEKVYLIGVLCRPHDILMHAHVPNSVKIFLLDDLKISDIYANQCQNRQKVSKNFIFI